EELRGAHTGDLNRILKGKEQSCDGALIRPHLEKVFTEKSHRPISHLVLLPTGKHLSERAFAGAVWAHDGVNLTGVDGEIEATKDFLAIDAGMKVLDFEHWFNHL